MVNVPSPKAAPAPHESWRYFATKLNGDGTETFLAGDLPLDDVQVSITLSGTNAVTATIPVEKSALEGSGRSIFIPWSTCVYAEKDGVIRSGGIVTDADLDGPTLGITVAGFSGYLHDLPYTDEKSWVYGDPFAIVKEMWSHAQKQDGGDLGLNVTFSPAATDVKVGRLPEESWPTYYQTDDMAAAGSSAGQWTSVPSLAKDKAKYLHKYSLPVEGTPFKFYRLKAYKNYKVGSQTYPAPNGYQTSIWYGIATRDYPTGKSSDTKGAVLVRNKATGYVFIDTNGDPDIAKSGSGFDVIGYATTGKPKVDADGEDYEAYTLSWYEDFDLGEKHDTLAEDTPFEWYENHVWSGEEIKHTLSYFYPSVGALRTDLRFVLGENVTVFPVVEVTGEDYASEVYVLGSGEGRKMIRGEYATKSTRLRRVKVETDKTRKSTSSAKKAAESIFNQMTGEDIKSITVINHSNAPIGSWSVGDRILIQSPGVGWASTLDVWLRILSYTIDPQTESCVLTVTRSERMPTT